MQKTAYKMRISDWSSDVCSSDLYGLREGERHHAGLLPFRQLAGALAIAGIALSAIGFVAMAAAMAGTSLLQVEPGTLTMLFAQTAVGTAFLEIGRASCGERGCQYV